MRWWTYKAEIAALQAKDPAGKKAQTYGKWHKKFAWKRVQVSQHCFAWLEFVERRGFFDKKHNWQWEYRYLQPRSETTEKGKRQVKVGYE